MNFTPPLVMALDTKHHNRAVFDCGVEPLNLYLQQQAGQNIKQNIARVFVAVATTESPVIQGYYSLSAAQIARDDLPVSVAKKLPTYPIPVAVLGRLAVDKNHQGQSIGKYLLVDALRRVCRAADSLGIYGIIVDAKNADLVTFYQKYGFQAFTAMPLKLYLPLASVEGLL